MTGGARFVDAWKLAGHCHAQQLFRIGRDAVALIEATAPVVEHCPLDVDQPLQCRQIAGAQRFARHQLQHGTEHRPTDCRWRVTGDLPASNRGHETVARQNPVSGQVFRPEASAGRLNMGGDPLSELAGIELLRTMAGDAFQAVGQVRHADRLTFSPELAGVVVQRPPAVFGATEDRLSRILQVVV